MIVLFYFLRFCPFICCGGFGLESLVARRGFLPKILEIYTTRGEKDNFM